MVLNEGMDKTNPTLERRESVSSAVAVCENGRLIIGRPGGNFVENPGHDTMRIVRAGICRHSDKLM